MSFQHTSNNGYGMSVLKRLVVLIAAGCLVGALSIGCSGETIEVNDGDESNQNQEENQDPNQEQQHNHDHNHEVEENHRTEEYVESHGPDEVDEDGNEMGLIDAGSLQGSWRAAYVDGDVPLGYFDIFHDDGESTASGDFMMGSAMGEMLAGTSGSIESVSLDGDQLEIRWNPTTAADEMYSLILNRSDAETYEGTFQAEMYPEEHEVKLTLREID